MDFGERDAARNSRDHRQHLRLSACDQAAMIKSASLPFCRSGLRQTRSTHTHLVHARDPFAAVALRPNRCSL